MEPIACADIPKRGGGRPLPWTAEDVVVFAQMLEEHQTIRACQRYQTRSKARYHAERLRLELLALGTLTTMRIWTEKTVGGQYYTWALTRL